jgi:hypothetical protein
MGTKEQRGNTAFADDLNGKARVVAPGGLLLGTKAGGRTPSVVVKS